MKKITCFFETVESKSIINDEMIGEKLLYSYILQLCMALFFLHSKSKLSYKRLYPSNILIRKLSKPIRIHYEFCGIKYLLETRDVLTLTDMERLFETSDLYTRELFYHIKCVGSLLQTPFISTLIDYLDKVNRTFEEIVNFLLNAEKIKEIVSVEDFL